ncbi:MarR family transcriptional regulator [Saccharothrix texasensis]|nr:MarR family transcriptional regulator [Saccharothrix texasensis]
MWAYVVLTELSRGAAPTRLAPARAVDVDKTKMVAIIDGMEAEGLVSRRPDPDDRRARITEPTAEGRKRWRGARAAVRRMEDGFLAELPPARRAAAPAAPRELSGEPSTRLSATS